jgi:GT2 family glycosyltransferase
MNAGKVRVSVVILSYNRKSDLSESILEIQKSDFKEFEIIVVDNGSKDGTVQMLREDFPEVRLIALADNIGVAGYNRGFRAALGEYILILDDDSFPIDNALNRICEEFDRSADIGIIALNVRNYYDFDQELEKTEGDNLLKFEGKTQLAFNGAGAAFRKVVFDEVGGYAEEFFLYWNEQDLALRVLDAGYKILWFIDIISLHKYSPVNRKSYRAPFFYTRNLYWLIWKHFYFSKCFKDTFKLIYLTLYHSFEQKTFIYLKAFFKALLGLGKIKRRPVRREIADNLRLTYKIPFIYL